MTENPSPAVPVAADSLAPAFERLRAVVARLRGDQGCPWDREQTVASVKRYLLLEVYELLEALDRPEEPGVLEELGDVLFQIAFLARLFEERSAFDLAAVAQACAEKMVRRHPHVFADRQLASSAEVLRNWSDLKAEARGESPGERSLLDGVPRALPALVKALELSERAAHHGFDWPDLGPVLAKLDEERAELAAAVAKGSAEEIADELGDLLFVVANLGRKLGANPEESLQRANAKFDRRFRFIESELRGRGQKPRDATLAEMDALWDEAKRRGL